MKDFKKIGIFTNPKIDRDIIKFVIEQINKNNMEAIELDFKKKYKNLFDLVITIGGDGTVLAGLIRFPDCPVLAINYGTVGFLTAGNRDELNKILNRIQNEDFIISERSILECIHPFGSTHAVNEVVIKGGTRLVNLQLTINGQKIREIRGDGFIVGSATGSTGYLLAAGSPIVMPELRCMILSGLNEYDFRARHLIVKNDSEIELTILESTREEEIYLASDGNRIGQLKNRDKIYIRESTRRAKLIFMESDYFFQNLSSRLSWFQK